MTTSDEQGLTSRLSEVFSPFFSLILQLRASSQFSDAEKLRSDITQVLGECEQQARKSVATEDVDDAKFALVAFVDETILSSNWSMKGAWMSRPLQLQLYNRFDAGEHFFERMDSILGQESSRLHVLEVYYLCLTLGFKGRYQLVEQEKLRSRIEAARARLKQSTPMKAGTLSPHGLPRDQVAAEVKSKLPTWAVIATAVTIGVLIYLALSVYVSRKASGVGESIESLTANTPLSSQLSGATLPIETVNRYA